MFYFYDDFRAPFLKGRLALIQIKTNFCFTFCIYYILYDKSLLYCAGIYLIKILKNVRLI